MTAGYYRTAVSGAVRRKLGHRARWRRNPGRRLAVLALMWLAKNS